MWRAPRGRVFDPAQTLRSLGRGNPRSACWATPGPNGAWFLGASPETLAAVRNGTLYTHALAGTAALGCDDLLRSGKDLREHALVRDAIVRALRPLSWNVTVGGAPRLRRLPRMQHLSTPIRAVLRSGVGPDEIVAALHPTPAVGGTPRRAALRFIEGEEPVPESACVRHIAGTFFRLD